MQLFARSIGSRIKTGFAAVLVLTVVVAMVGGGSLWLLQARAQLVDQGHRVASGLAAAREGMARFVATADPGTAIKVRDELRATGGRLQGLAGAADGEEARTVAALRPSLQQLQTSFLDVERKIASREEHVATLATVADGLERAAQDILDHETSGRSTAALAATAAEQRAAAARVLAERSQQVARAAATAQILELEYLASAAQGDLERLRAALDQVVEEGRALEEVAARTDLAEAAHGLTEALVTYRTSLDELIAAQVSATEQATAIATMEERIGVWSAKFEEAGQRLDGLVASLGQESGAAVDLGTLRDVARLQRLIDGARLAEKDYQVHARPEDRQRLEAALKELFTTALRLKRQLQGTQGAAIVAEMQAAAQSYRKDFAELAEAIDERNAASATSDKVQSDRRRLQKLVGDLSRGIDDVQTDQARAAVAAADEAGRRMDRHVRAVEIAGRIISGIYRGRELVVRARIEGATDRARLTAVSDTLTEDLLGATAELTGFVERPEDRTRLEGFRADVERFGDRLSILLAEIESAAAAEDEAARHAEAIVDTVERLALTINERFATTKFTVLGLLLGGTLLALALGAVCAFVITRGVVRPLATLTDRMQALAAGELDAPVPGRDRTDEVAHMAAAVEVFREQGQRMRSLAGEFERLVVRVVGGMGDAIDRLRGSAETMAEMAAGSERESVTVSATTAKVGEGIGVVATATEELDLSIGQINEQIRGTNELATTATSRLGETDEAVSDLVAAVQQIANITRMINEVAEQTNLLALNATIEAARAGAAGKGFAVVAHEVKQLADQTAKATGEIETQIEAVRQRTERTVEAIGVFKTAMGELQTIAAAIAAAGEQQAAATRKITRTTQGTASSAIEANAAIGHVVAASRETTSAAVGVMGETRTLEEQAQLVHRAVEGFLTHLRMAA